MKGVDSSDSQIDKLLDSRPRLTDECRLDIG